MQQLTEKILDSSVLFQDRLMVHLCKYKNISLKYAQVGLGGSMLFHFYLMESMALQGFITVIDVEPATVLQIQTPAAASHIN